MLPHCRISPPILCLCLAANLAVCWAVEQPASGADYVLGPEDVLSITAIDAPEISNQPVRIETSGYIRLPMAGQVCASGLSVPQLEEVLSHRLKEYIKRPEVSVRVAEYRSQPVTVIGSVNNPGVHQVQGHKTLLEILSMTGGLRNDAGYMIKLTRRNGQATLPCQPAQQTKQQFSVTEINIESLLKANKPEANVTIQAHDVISVPPADMLFVVGEVRKAGGFTMRGGERLSVLVALSLAEGVTPMAAPEQAKVLRLKAGSSQRTEIPVNLKKMLSGKMNDVDLQQNDILFVPNSLAKSVTKRSVDAALQIGTGLVIWRR